MLYKIFFLTLLLSTTIFGQQVRINPFAVTASDIFEDLKQFKNSKSNITPEELSKQGDDLIAAKGLNFVFSFDADICRKVTDARQQQKDKTKPVRLNAQINSVEGDIANITLPEIRFEAGGCGKCFVRMPLAEFNDKEFVSFVQDRIVRFYTPKNINYEEVKLVDTQNLSTVVRTWKVPFRSTPLGISDDGKMIVLNPPFDEFKEIALLVYDDGTFRFYPKKDLDLTAKSDVLKTVAGQNDSANTSLIAFSKESFRHVLKFNTNCQ